MFAFKIGTTANISFLRPLGVLVGHSLRSAVPEQIGTLAITPCFSMSSHLVCLPLCHGLLDDGFGEVNLGGLDGGEACFEGVAEGHEFVDFGDYAV